MNIEKIVGEKVNVVKKMKKRMKDDEKEMGIEIEGKNDKSEEYVIKGYL